MAKLTLLDIASLQNETTAIQTLNENFTAIETAFDNTLSREGTTPNQLEADLDVNSQRVINLAAPQAGTDAARLVDIQEAALPTIVVPSLSGNNGKLLSNDETALAWVDPVDIPGIGDLKAVNNLSDLANTATARTNLGLGSAAQQAIGTSGGVVPRLDGANTWSAGQTFTAGGSSNNGWAFQGTTEVRLTYTPTSLSDDSAGFRGAPLNVQDTTYTFSIPDSGRTLKHTAAGAHTWTIPPNTSVSFPTGTTIVVHNTGAGVVTLAQGSGVTLRVVGTGATGNRSLSQHGLATLFKSDTDIWYVTGSGVS